MVTNFELKTLQAQNEKLRDTLVSMRDLSAHEKHEIQKLAKVILYSFFFHSFAYKKYSIINVLAVKI